MVVATLILIVSTGLLLFYFQTTCQRILRHRFEQEYFRAIVNANRLEFLAIRKAVEEFDAPVEFARVRMTLKCDYFALTYLLKNAANAGQRYSREERLLILYFRLVLFSLMVRHWLRLRETPGILRLTQVLQYFANVIGQRVSTIRFGGLTATEYATNF